MAGSLRLLFTLFALWSLPSVASEPEDFYVEVQETPNVCWAAAVQSILHHRGLSLTQLEIGAHATGSDLEFVPEVTATPAQVTRLFLYFGIPAKRLKRAATPEEMKTLFAERGSVLAEVYPSHRSHAVVIQDYDADGNLIVSDPWYGTTRRWTREKFRKHYRWRDSILVGRASAPAPVTETPNSSRL